MIFFSNSHLQAARLLVVAIAGCGAASLTGLNEANACACCDSTDERTPLAWNNDGSQLLVLRKDTTECHNLTAVEVWDVGAASPKACYDIHSPDPTKAIACNNVIDLHQVEKLPAQVTLEKDFRTHLLRLTGLTKTFTKPVKQARKRKDYRIKKGARDNERSFPCQHVTVTAINGKKQTPLYDTCVDLKPYNIEFEQGAFLRPKLSVWRSPNPDVFLLTALIFKDGNRAHGWLSTDLHWADLSTSDKAGTNKKPSEGKGKKGSN